MSSTTGISALARSFGATVSSLLKSRRGVAAIEFAFIAPVLLVLYFMTMEVSQAIETNKKVGRAASMIADLITQQPSISKSEIDAIMQIGKATIQPYNRSQLSVYATGVTISNDASANATVAWSRRMVSGGTPEPDPDLAPGKAIAVPTELRIPGTFLVRVQTRLDYRPLITWTADAKQTLGLLSAFDNINMSEQYYLRPRMSDTVSCGDC
jgi:Flp pilus assembly protein TadG